MYKSAQEVAALLAMPYDGPIEERKGPGGQMFSYVPWTETYRRLNTVFGVFGWSTNNLRQSYANGTYTVSFDLTVTVVDDENGFTITKTVPAIGQAAARGEGDDNAAKSASSDALSRGAKLLGDAFGFQLYEKKSSSRSSTPRTDTRASDGLGPRPSEKQQTYLKKAGVDWSTMPFSEWKAALDDYFASSRKQTTPDDLPF